MIVFSLIPRITTPISNKTDYATMSSNNTSKKKMFKIFIYIKI